MHFLFSRRGNVDHYNLNLKFGITILNRPPNILLYEFFGFFPFYDLVLSSYLTICK